MSLPDAMIPDGLVRDAPLDRLTTIRVGGAADWYAEPRGSRAVVALLAWAKREGVPVAVVGKGSNLIVDDAGFRGLVIHPAGPLSAISVRGTLLICGGASSFPRAVIRAAASGLTGLEWGASIPGTAGGAVAMNAGAHGGEVKDRLEWAVLASAEGRRRVDRDDLEFSYRHSAVRADEVVCYAAFRLEVGEKQRVDETMAEFRTHRRSTQPQGVRTFGSVFTNPEGDSAGRLLEAAGCKELTVGGARFSPVHANFIEAGPGATSDDVRELIAEGRRRVLASGGPALHPEVRYLHPTSGIQAAIEEDVA